jgi:hypothetical protein
MSRQRQRRRHSDVDTAAAVAAMWMAAAITAARYSGDRLGTAGRYVGNRARRFASESTTRGAVAYHALRGDLPKPLRRRREYLAVTVLGGAAGAATALGLRRMVARNARTPHHATEPVVEAEARRAGATA